MSHYVERFSAAISVLASHGHIKQRLVRAYQDNLTMIEAHRLPQPMQQPFADLWDRMHLVAPLNGEGPIRASVRKMSTEEADECAQLMVELYGTMMRLCGDEQTPSLVAEDQPRDNVPPFLVKSG